MGKKSGKALTDRQAVFVREYLIDLNASQAAIRARYKAANADVIGPKLRAQPVIAEAIETALAERAARIDIKADNVIRELGKVAFFDIRGLQTSKIKPQDKVRALELLGRHLNLFHGEQVTINNYRDLSDEEIDARIKTAMKKNGPRG